MAEHWFISGANRGIGHGLATLVAERGDDVTASVRSEKAREALQRDVARHRARFAIVSFDTRDEDAIRAAAKTVEEPIDVLVCNAGAYGPQSQSTLDMDFRGALDLFDVNTLGPLRVVQALLPHLRRAEKPRIVLISSGLGSTKTAGSTNIAYRAAKAALNKIAQGLAHDLERDGIIVVALNPGWVRTDMGGRNAELSVEESASGIVATIDALTPGDSGRFVDYRGEDTPW
ncbi:MULTISPECIES: SDR family oxidoreductase [Methylosinus]|uniref:Short-chain dehydrogenase n=1 Tax=Methylosinus trichosporium (strain ATCC 35070 / NCIMB 11131 / UNIQEM 75 / OB3b) TaxID=595536 RepID=A0A2D2CZ98_METT3|nr:MULTISPECIES: SDR family oxidoreductase [Methylosinus]ATQ68056.1 short-chain dehydrogenase [Methylosinus trichosporium OB3b]OBS53672.1 short-chain dehydrogenase [Methylosinus sp. 3S-1]